MTSGRCGRPAGKRLARWAALAAAVWLAAMGAVDLAQAQSDPGGLSFRQCWSACRPTASGDEPAGCSECIRRLCAEQPQLASQPACRRVGAAAPTIRADDPPPIVTLEPEPEPEPESEPEPIPAPRPEATAPVILSEDLDDAPTIAAPTDGPPLAAPRPPIRPETRARLAIAEELTAAAETIDVETPETAPSGDDASAAAVDQAFSEAELAEAEFPEIDAEALARAQAELDAEETFDAIAAVAAPIGYGLFGVLVLLRLILLRGDPAAARFERPAPRPAAEQSWRVPRAAEADKDDKWWEDFGRS